MAPPGSSNVLMTRKAIIIGATSGIGKSLAFELHKRGYTIGITGRRKGRLEKIRAQLRSRVHTQFMDVTDIRGTYTQLRELMEEMGGMDLIVLNAGVAGFRDYSWASEERIIDVNVRGFSALANFAFDYFEQRGQGHIVGMSSVASLFGYGLSATYNASKAFVSIYLQGYRQRANHSEADITITDIKAGFVNSEMTTDKKGMFWVADTETATRQIANTIEGRRNHAYITRRWRLVAWLIKIIPNWIFDRI